MSFISQCADGSGWDVYLTVPGGDATCPRDERFVGHCRSLWRAARLMRRVLKEQTGEATTQRTSRGRIKRELRRQRRKHNRGGRP